MPKIFTVGALLMVFIVTCGQPKDTEQRLILELENSLPKGSSVSQVIAFLNARNIEQFGFEGGRGTYFYTYRRSAQT